MISKIGEEFLKTVGEEYTYVDFSSKRVTKVLNPPELPERTTQLSKERIPVTGTYMSVSKSGEVYGPAVGRARVKGVSVMRYPFQDLPEGTYTHGFKEDGSFGRVIVFNEHGEAYAITEPDNTPHFRDTLVKRPVRAPEHDFNVVAANQVLADCVADMEAEEAEKANKLKEEKLAAIKDAEAYVKSLKAEVKGL